MENESVLVGIDIGTTGSRCMIFDMNGQCVASAYREYPLHHLRAGWVEQSLPEMMEATASACLEAVGKIDAKRIASVGLSTQQCATCPTTSAGELIRPMISWQDIRADAQAQHIQSQIGAARYQSITGVPAIASVPLAKILWLREHEPKTFERADKWLQVQDLMLKFLGAEDFFVDISQATYYGMWDVSKLDWNDELLALAGLDASHFGKVVPAGTQVGEISPMAAARTGLPAGAPLCVGAGDQACGAVGMGAVAPGITTITLGTAGMVTMCTEKPRIDLTDFITINHPLVGQWALQAPTLAAASCYSWFRDTFGQAEIDAAERDGGNAFELLNELAAQAPSGCDGLIFLPYLNSAGAPYWNTEARGAYLGFMQNHGRAHFARAVMEGVVLEVHNNLTRLAEQGLPLDVIRLGGGATHSPLWNQIQADVYGKPVQVLEEEESTALGAAILAAVGAGVFSDINEAVAAMVHVKATIDPDPATHALLTETYAIYADAYRSLAATTFGKIAKLQAG
jgi:xylulokinase